MTAQPGRRGGAPRHVLHALGALGALGVVLVVVPIVLVALTQALPIDLGALAPGAWGHADDGRLLLLAIVGVAWAAWAVMVLSIAVEAWASVRRVPTPALPGMAVPQRVAAALVAAILVALSTTAGAPAAGAPPVAGGEGFAAVAFERVASPSGTTETAADMQSGAAVGSRVVGDPATLAPGSRSHLPVTSVHTAGGPLATAVAAASLEYAPDGDIAHQVREGRAGWSADDRASSLPDTPRVTTERHDTLWMLAERFLGTGERFVEIVDLNRGVEQPDGRSLGDDGRIYPGWSISLPADAAVDAPRPDRHRVVRGDTLWRIAEVELGDPRRYDEIAAANRGDLQPDGRRLGDPDLILPGWVLEIPGAQAGAEGSAESAPEDQDRGEPEVGVAGDGATANPADSVDAAESSAGDSRAGDAVQGPADGSAAAEDATADAAHTASGPDSNPPMQDLAPIDRGPTAASSPADTVPAHTSPAPAATAQSDADVPTLDRGTSVTGSTATEAAGAAVAADSQGGGPELGRARGTVAPGTGGTTPSATPSATPSSPAAAASATPATSASPAVVPPAPPAPVLPATTPGTPAQPSATPSAATDDLGDAVTWAGGPALLLPAGGTVAALLLAGVGAELVRRRRQFQRHRRPGERMPAPAPGAAQVEAAVRAAVREPGLTVFERALVALAQESAAIGHPLPDVRIVRVGSDSLVLELASPGGPAISPFVAADDTRWVLSPGMLDPDLPELPEVPRALPSLVTVGFTGSETVLLNLDSVGTLVVAGSPEASADVVRGLAAELAFGPASALTERTLCLADPAIAEAVEAGGIGVESEPALIVAALRTVMARSSAGHPADADPPLIVLCDHDLDVRIPARSGCALITTTAVVGAGATLAVHESGAAVLLPERLHLAPQRLSQTATVDVVSAVIVTDLPETSPETPSHDRPTTIAVSDEEPGAAVAPGPAEGPKPAASAVRPPDVIDLRVGAWPPEGCSGIGPDAPAQDSRLSAPEAAQNPSPAVDSVPRVLLLGEVLVENAAGRCESTRIGRLAETAAFVLLNPGARPSELQGALWPGRRSNPQTCRQMISRARTWLGRTEAGEPYLMAFAESGGRLRLREEVTSDWADFQRLAEVGLADPADTEHLTEALALVRGRPFGAVASRELPWADIHINEMISLISDVAHALAVRHELAGSQRAARDAALRGLRTESESEVLEEIVARTAG